MEARPHSTHVYVSPQLTSASVPPELSLPQTQSTLPPRMGGQQINWGGIAKGAAIVAGVVVVGVVGAWLLSNAVAASPLLASVFANLGTGAAWAGDAGMGILEVGFKTLMTFGEGVATGLANAGITLPSIGGGAASTAVVQAQASSMASWIGGLGATVVALPVALKHLATIPFMEPTLATGGADIAAQTAAAKKTTVIAQQPTQHYDPTQSPEHLLDDHAAASTSKVAKVAQHVVDDQQEYQQHRRQHAQAALARSAQANQSWADRTGGPREPIRPVSSRQNQSFAENLEADAARNAALPNGGRA